MWVRWTRNLGDFERSVRLIFGFLSEERGYSEPAVKYGRDFSLVYAGGVGSSEGLEISIVWEEYGDLLKIHHDAIIDQLVSREAT
jgi:hypothetical protein